MTEGLPLSGTKMVSWRDFVARRDLVHRDAVCERMSRGGGQECWTGSLR